MLSSKADVLEHHALRDESRTFAHSPNPNPNRAESRTFVPEPYPNRDVSRTFVHMSEDSAACSMASMSSVHGSRVHARQSAQSPPLAVPQLGSSLRLLTGLPAGPLGTQPLPRVLERAGSNAAHFFAFDHPMPLQCRR